MNFDPAANEDDGSCEFNLCPQVEITIVTYTFSNGEEVSWTMDGVDAAPEDSTAMHSGMLSDFGLHTYTACMAAGCYRMTLHDASSDGWDQGWVEIWMDGDLMATGTYEAGSTNSMVLGIGADCEANPEADGGVTNESMSSWSTTIDVTPYPNPSGETVNILGSGFDHQSPVSVKVRDGVGRMVTERRISPSATRASWSVDVRDWPAGMYTIEATQGGHLGTARFVVTH